MPFCEHCGVDGGGDYCASCGQVRSFAAKSAGQTPRPIVQQQVTVVANQTHGVPALISFFLPGLGQLIKGHIAKAVGLWIFLLFSIGAGVMFGAVMPLAWVFAFLVNFALWCWNVYDAYTSNEKPKGFLDP